MHTNSFECPLCSCEYNEDSHILPKSLLCGHTICSNCLSNIITKEPYAKCPYDRKPLQHNNHTDFPTNVLVLQLLDEHRRLNKDVCSLHQEPLVFVRMADKTKMCSYCCYLDNDKQSVTHVKEIKKQASEKASELRKIEKELASYQEEIQTQLDKKRHAMLEMVRTSYEKMHEDLRQREEALKSEVLLFYSHQMHFAEQKIFQDYPQVNDIKQLISELTACNLTDNFFNALERKLEPVPESLKAIVDDLQLNFDNTSFVLSDDNNEQILNVVTDFLELQGTGEEIKISPRLVPAQSSLSQENINEIQTLLKESKSIRLTNSQLKSSRKFFESFYVLWQHMKAVDSLSLELSCNKELSEETVSALYSYTHWNFDKLNHFALDLQACENVNALALLNIFSSLVRKMKNLKKIDLVLNSIRMSNPNVLIGPLLGQMFLQANIQLTSIKTFSLHLQENHMKDNELKDIIDNMKSLMPSLSSLELRLDYNEVADSGVMFLFRELKDSLKELECFEIGLIRTGITKRSVEFFIREILPVMTNLKKFVFSIQDTRVEKDEVKDFIDELKNYANEGFDFRIELTELQITKRTVENRPVLKEGKRKQEAEKKEEGEEEEEEKYHPEKADLQEKKPKQKAKHLDSDFLLFGSKEKKLIHRSSLKNLDLPEELSFRLIKFPQIQSKGESRRDNASVD